MDPIAPLSQDTERIPMPLSGLMSSCLPQQINECPLTADGVYDSDCQSHVENTANRFTDHFDRAGINQSAFFAGDYDVTVMAHGLDFYSGGTINQIGQMIFVPGNVYQELKVNLDPNLDNAADIFAGTDGFPDNRFALACRFLFAYVPESDNPNWSADRFENYNAYLYVGNDFDASPHMGPSNSDTFQSGLISLWYYLNEYYDNPAKVSAHAIDRQPAETEFDTHRDWEAGDFFIDSAADNIITRVGNSLDLAQGLSQTPAVQPNQDAYGQTYGAAVYYCHDGVCY